jgi:Domain of unknown function (DUF222)/HNH endonuclease
MFVNGSPAPASAPASSSSLGDRLADLPLELIEREIESLAAQINAGCARWLELVAEFDRREGWGGTGCRTTCEWVAWRCALTPRSAREHVRVARALPALPEIRAAFVHGELSYSKVRALSRVADAQSEADLLELARHATAAQLERMVRAARRATAADADEAQRQSSVRWYWDDDDGCLHIDARLPPEDGATFLRALEAARDALHARRNAEAVTDHSGNRADGSAEPLAATEPSGSAEPPRTPSPSNAESLVALAEAALARPPTGLPGGERYQVFIHVDAKTLATDSPGASVTGPGECAIADGPGISPETARRLACDSSVVALLEHNGEPLSVGRRTRTVPPSIRRALVARDGRCQFPGCERRRFVDAHHIQHWARGGETALDNLVLLCRHHHRLVHEGGFSVSRDQLGHGRFTRPDGRPITASPSTRARPDPLRRQRAGPLLTGTGEKMDLASCVDAVLVATGRGGFAPG